MKGTNLFKNLILRISFIITILLEMFVMNLKAQTREFSLEDLNSGGVNYYRMTPEDRFLSWWKDELIRIDVDECFQVDKTTNKETLLFSIDDLNSWAEIEDSVKIRSLFPCIFPYPDKPQVLVYSKNERLIFDFNEKKLIFRQDKTKESFSDWNPFSKAVAFVYQDNLFVTNSDGQLHQISTDGSKDIVYGQVVHRDEFGIYKGTFWSPKGDKLCFYRMDQSMVTSYPLIDISKRIATEEPIKYPMAGETSHKVEVGVYDLKTDKTIYLDTGDPTDRYFTNIKWSPDGKYIYMIEINRKQTDMDLVYYETSSGKRKGVIYSEHNDKYVHPMTEIEFLPWDDSQFILQSQKDGYNHLYLFDTKGNEIKQITKGNWVVLDLVGFNKDKKDVIILSTESSPIQNNIYSVNIETGKRKLLDNGKGCHLNITEDSGHHDEALSFSGKWLFDNFSEPDVPRIINIIDIDNCTNNTYFTAPNPWEGMKAPEFICGTIKAADNITDLYYRMVKPVDFDINKKYPTIVYVYGGPGSRNVEASWHYDSRGWETYMAQKGYLLFILDNRGSKDRGIEFEQATFHELGVHEMEDQIKGVEFLKTLPYVDASRLGVHGWSFGGFMTISLMTTYPDIFKVGVAGGPVIDWKWYEVMYTERYMGTPQDNPIGYKKTSLIDKAMNLKGKLQIIIGTDDPVVVPQHALSFIQASIEAGIQLDYFVYPGEPHNIRGHQSVHLHERITQYFEDYLK